MVAESSSRSEKSSRGTRIVGKTQIPLPTRLKARNLFVIQQLPASDVAAACGLTKTQVYNLSHRHKWVQVRRENVERVSGALTTDEKTQIDEISREAASLSDEGLLGSLRRANEATESRHEFASKDAQAFASAARSLMQVGRTLRGMDNASAKGGGDAGATQINFFVGRFGPAVSEKNVTPSKVALEAGAATVDVAASAASDAPSK